MSRVDLTNHPIVATEFGRWQPLNGPLGLTAFGINAVVCDPGEAFDIRHDETESGHQEVYVVVSGRAEFTLDDDTVEAGPGQIVAVPDPASVRQYRALEPDTRIVCVGAAPGDAHPYGDWITDAAQA
jgi:uncharacterized cupin superfamily protein